MVNNITDQPKPEIKVPILKPVKATKMVNENTAKTTADAVQKQLNKFADWILLYVPPEVKKPIDSRVEALKKM